MNSYKFLDDTLHVGQQSILQLSFDDSVTVNALPNVVGVLIVGDVKPTDTSVSLSQIWNIDFSTFKLGVLNFDSLEIPFVNKNGKDSILYIHGDGPVVGTSVLDTNFKSSYFGNADYPLPKGEVATISALGLIIIAIITILIYKFVTREKPVPPKPFYEDPEKSSKEKLDELLAMKLWENEDGLKEHYFILTEIIKFHFSVELQESFMENTTIEILAKLKEKFQYEQFKRIKQFFDDADIVKYTKMIPSNEEVFVANSSAGELIKIVVKKDEEVWWIE